MASRLKKNFGLVSNPHAAAVMFQCSCLLLTAFAVERIMLRAGILYTPGCEWSRAQIDCMLTAIGTRDYS